MIKKSRVYVGLINPKSPDNVGSIMRAAGNYGVDEVVYTGKRYPRALMRNTGLPDLSRKVGQKIPLTGALSIIDVVPDQMTVVCVEFAEGAIPLPDFQHPQSAFYIFGPEDGTLEQEIINQTDQVVYVPTIGCMNLAATVNVVLYDRIAKTSGSIWGDDFIRQNRDINNRIKIK